MGRSMCPFPARELPVGARQWGNTQKYLPERLSGNCSRERRVRPIQREPLLDGLRGNA